MNLVVEDGLTISTRKRTSFLSTIVDAQGSKCTQVCASKWFCTRRQLAGNSSRTSVSSHRDHENEASVACSLLYGSDCQPWGSSMTALRMVSRQHAAPLKQT